MIKDEQGRGHSHTGGHSHSGRHAHGVSSELGFVDDPELTLRPSRDVGFAQGLNIFLDPQSGIAGDMFVASFLDLGVPLSAIKEALSQISLGGYELKVCRGYSGVIATTHFSVQEIKEQPQRNYAEIKRLLLSSTLAPGVQKRALAIFLTLAEAESEVHGLPLDEVEFHEVGAIDSIVDIVAAATCIEYAGAQLLVGPVQVGQGWVNCQHGRLPLPAPATLNCLKDITIISSGLEAELVTPTGAAILGSQTKAVRSMPAINLEAVAYGAGTRGLPDRPNALRILLGECDVAGISVTEEQGGIDNRQVALLSCNLDDMTGEALSFAVAELISAGALDAWLSPITMKKGRPAIELSLLTLPEKAQEFSHKIMELTSSLGVRQALMSRYELEREIVSISTEWGPIRLKRSQFGGVKPEYEDCAQIARQQGLPLATIINEALRAYQDAEG